jgi:hypothetical protein
MKKLISETDGYRVYASVTSVPHPEGYKMLEVTSQWDTAKNPEEEQTRFKALLSPTTLQAYQQLFNEAV